MPNLKFIDVSSREIGSRNLKIAIINNCFEKKIHSNGKERQDHREKVKNIRNYFLV